MSTILEPLDFFTIKGDPETAENDRTGELTPPGIIFFVLLNNFRLSSLHLFFPETFLLNHVFYLFLIKDAVADSNHIRLIFYS